MGLVVHPFGFIFSAAQLLGLILDRSGFCVLCGFAPGFVPGNFLILLGHERPLSIYFSPCCSEKLLCGERGRRTGWQA